MGPFACLARSCDNFARLGAPIRGRLPLKMSLTSESFIVNVAAWSEAELHDVEVLSLRNDVLELGGKIANYRIIVKHSVVTLYGFPIDAGGPLTVLAVGSDDLRGWQYICRTLRRTENIGLKP